MRIEWKEPQYFHSRGRTGMEAQMLFFLLSLSLFSLPLSLLVCSVKYKEEAPEIYLKKRYQKYKEEAPEIYFFKRGIRLWPVLWGTRWTFHVALRVALKTTGTESGRPSWALITGQTCMQGTQCQCQFGQVCVRVNVSYSVNVSLDSTVSVSVWVGQCQLQCQHQFG